MDCASIRNRPKSSAQSGTSSIRSAWVTHAPGSRCRTACQASTATCGAPRSQSGRPSSGWGCVGRCSGRGTAHRLESERPPAPSRARPKPHAGRKRERGGPRSPTASSPCRPARKIAPAHAAGKCSPGLGSGRGWVADGSRAGRWVAGRSRPVTLLIRLRFRPSALGRVVSGYRAQRPENRRKHRARACFYFGSSVYGKSHSLAHRENLKIEEQGLACNSFRAQIVQ